MPPQAAPPPNPMGTGRLTVGKTHDMHLWAGHRPVEEEEVPYWDELTDHITVREADIDVEQVVMLLHDPSIPYTTKVHELAAFDRKWAYKGMDQTIQLKTEANSSHTAWADTENDLFLCSSDDSDGHDPDFNADWGEHTGSIFSVCRALGANNTCETAISNFVALLADLKDTPLPDTDQRLIWDAVRLMYREAEPVHCKRWLTSCSELVDGVAFCDRPSLVGFLAVAAAAAEFGGLRECQRAKARRWSRKTMVLFHKRVAALKEFGVRNPSWQQVKVSQHARTVTVPEVLLHNAVPALSANDTKSPDPCTTGPAAEPSGRLCTPSDIRNRYSTRDCEQGPSESFPRCCDTLHAHFPCDRSPSQPHHKPPS
ncbi:hypothetical protein DIPPA_21162 [Diplonema papillatum]|nr:hypothetical protein DIPPA_21162 [Diplonema papillatum]